jgi:hypothetical protein
MQSKPQPLGKNFLYSPIMSGRSNNSVGKIAVYILLGLVFGGILGESLGWLFGYIGTLMNAGGEDNVVRNFFVKAWELKLGYSENGNPMFVDLYMLQFSFGITFKLNIISIVGVAVALYMMKWSRNR